MTNNNQENVFDLNQDHNLGGADEQIKINEPTQNIGSGFGRQFFVRSLTGSILAFKLNADMTILQLKKEIEDKQHIPVDQQRIVYQGKQLEDNNTLGYYEISDNADLHLVTRLRGGN
nr:ubiquitin-like [Hydra vulgaris]